MPTNAEVFAAVEHLTAGGLGRQAAIAEVAKGYGVKPEQVIAAYWRHALPARGAR